MNEVEKGKSCKGVGGLLLPLFVKKKGWRRGLELEGI